MKVERSYALLGKARSRVVVPAFALLMVVAGMGACEPPPAGKTPSTPAPAEPQPPSGTPAPAEPQPPSSAPDATEPPAPSVSGSSDNAQPTGGGQPAGAGSARAGNPPGCPGSFREASGLQVDCEQPAIDFCAYPEGTCACDAPRQCGGMRRERVLSWSCKPKPPAVRADGCPGELPKSGEACAPEGKRCRYHRCDPSVECRGGRWKLGSRKRRRSRP